MSAILHQRLLSSKPWTIIIMSGLLVIALFLLGIFEYQSRMNQQVINKDRHEAKTEKPDDNIDTETQRYLEDLDDLVSGIPQFAGAEYEASIFGDICPIRLPKGCFHLRYQQGIATESWYGYSSLDCRTAAAELLQNLEDDGFMLVKASFLNLSKEAWGCTVKSPDDSVFIITLIPAKKSTYNNPGNRLDVTVVHIRKPEVEHIEGSEL